MIKIRGNTYFYLPDDTIPQLTKRGITNHGQMLLLTRIGAHTLKGSKACNISNQYLSKLLCISERTLTRWLRELKDTGLIDMKVDRFRDSDGNIVTERSIFLTDLGRWALYGEV